MISWEYATNTYFLSTREDKGDEICGINVASVGDCLSPSPQLQLPGI